MVEVAEVTDRCEKNLAPQWPGAVLRQLRLGHRVEVMDRHGDPVAVIVATDPQALTAALRDCLLQRAGQGG